MNIDRIIADESTSSYANRVERSLNNVGLTFIDLKNYIRVGSSNHGITDAAFKSYLEMKTMPKYQYIKHIVYVIMK